VIKREFDLVNKYSFGARLMPPSELVVVDRADQLGSWEMHRKCRESNGKRRGNGTAKPIG